MTKSNKWTDKSFQLRKEKTSKDLLLIIAICGHDDIQITYSYTAESLLHLQDNSLR